MKLRFHLSLCNHQKKLKSVCNKILNKASIGIRDEIIKTLDKTISLRTLKTRCNQSRTNIKNKTAKENYRLIKKNSSEKNYNSKT